MSISTVVKVYLKIVSWRMVRHYDLYLRSFQKMLSATIALGKTEHVVVTVTALFVSSNSQVWCVLVCLKLTTNTPDPQPAALKGSSGMTENTTNDQRNCSYRNMQFLKFVTKGATMEEIKEKQKQIHRHRGQIAGYRRGGGWGSKVGAGPLHGERRS